MKSATFPSLRVSPALRQAAEDVLEEGETLSGFVEASVRAQIELRRSQAAFIQRGLASREKARKTGVYVSSGALLKKLEGRLIRAKKSRE